jgi:anaerobic ribonucleoside-triphosphate reductase activating protein
MTVWVYTGYTIEKIIQTRFLSRMLPYIDVLVDGPFIKELRNTNLPFRGSENQRIIDVKKYIKREKDYEWHLG